ncbi:MAG: DUF4328 domain-containing protein [Myxococcales bacterium]|nr:DUF4328 domain-containing protein [Myxococcales bacterium]
MDTEHVYQAPQSDLQVSSEPPPNGEPPGYVDQAFRLRVVGVGLFACGIITLLSLGFHALSWWDLHANAYKDFATTLHGVQARSFKIALWSMLIFYVTAIFFGMFLYRASDNTWAFGARRLRFSPGWTVGWFMIPIANLFVPYFVLKELWWASGERVEQPQTSGNIKLWWVLWLVGALLELVVATLKTSSVREEFMLALVLTVVVRLMDLGNAWFAWQMLAEIHKRQRASAWRTLEGNPASRQAW